MSLYVHVPYCDSLCFFCGCTTVITKRHDKEEPYVDRILAENYYSRLRDLTLVCERPPRPTEPPTTLIVDNLFGLRNLMFAVRHNRQAVRQKKLILLVRLGAFWMASQRLGDFLFKAPNAFSCFARQLTVQVLRGSNEQDVQRVLERCASSAMVPVDGPRWLTLHFPDEMMG